MLPACSNAQDCYDGRQTPKRGITALTTAGKLVDGVIPVGYGERPHRPGDPLVQQLATYIHLHRDGETGSNAAPTVAVTATPANDVAVTKLQVVNAMQRVV